VYLLVGVFLMTGTGADGDEWRVEGVFATRDKAEAYKAAYESPRFRPDGSSYILEADVEEWNLDPAYVPDDDQVGGENVKK
jgi:hypothetical protein